jgi:hydroxyacylglutathione hydrolase
MKLHRFETHGLAQYAYLLASNGEVVVIDPMRDIDTYLVYAAAHDLRITHVLETHIHADFASGATALAARTGATLAVSAYDRGELYTCAFPHHPLHDGDTLKVGALRIQALHTPGHTPEHLSFLVFDTAASNVAPAALFTGDFLFVGSVGRPDLLGEDAKIALAHSLYDSLHRRIEHLPDSLILYPGHGAGSLCGADLGDAPTSTLGHERASNPLFQLDEPSFVATVLASVPPMPAYYPRMKALNAAGAPALAELPGGKPLTVEALRSLHAAGAVLLDTRRPEAFGGAHIPGSLNMGAGQNIPLWAGWLLSPDAPIVLIGDSGDRASTQNSVRRDLVRVGIDSAIGCLDGGIAAWINAGLPLASIEQISASSIPSGSLILDVRTDAEWTAGHIPSSQHIMLGDLATAAAALDKSHPVLTVCGSGYRSSIAAGLLTNSGFTQVGSLAGGISAYKKRGLMLVA